MHGSAPRNTLQARSVYPIHAEQLPGLNRSIVRNGTGKAWLGGTLPQQAACVSESSHPEHRPAVLKHPGSSLGKKPGSTKKAFPRPGMPFCIHINKWWLRVDSNHRHPHYECILCTLFSMEILSFISILYNINK